MVLDGRFRLQSLVGEGGLSAVYRAQDGERGDAAAVKIFHAITAGLPDVRRRWRREAELCRMLGSPTGAALRGHGLHDGRPWLAFDYLDGATLREWRGQRAVPAGEGVSLAQRLLELVAAVHALRVAHRDLKPTNVMRLGDGKLRLVDLGAALPFGERPARDLVAGTAAYGAPEQLAGEAADPRGDLYSVGVMLFELLCGQRPFQGDPMVLLDAHARLPPPRARALVPSLSTALDELVDKALAKRPEARYASAQAMQAALAAVPEATPDPGGPR